MKLDGWLIKAQPHVMMHLKRVFPQIKPNLQSNGIGLMLSDTIENCREIEWFLQRWSLDISETDKLHLTQRSSKHREQEDLVAKMLAGITEQEPFDLAIDPRQYQVIAARLVLSTGSLLLADDLGLGKENPVNTRICTPSGWRCIGDVRVGDFVTGSNGKPTRVLGVYPQGKKKSYRVHFNDGTSVEAGDEHLWAVEYYVGGRKQLHRIVVTTNQLRTGAKLRKSWANGRTTDLNLAGVRLYLPMLSAPIEFEQTSSPPLNAYLVGQLIANGSLTAQPTLVVGAVDSVYVIERIKNLVNIGYTVTRGGATSVVIKKIRSKIVDLGLNVKSAEKRIPHQYMFASVQDRIDLLHGLMDGDGTCSAERSRVTYSTKSIGLANDLRQLVESLAGSAIIRSYDRTKEGKGIEYALTVRLPSYIPPFSLPRKLARYKPIARKEPTRTFERIELAQESVESVCIAVDAPDHLYVTEHCILTHNTCSAICMISDPRARPALVVTMTHLTTQWQSEFKKFAPGLRTRVLEGTKPYDLTVLPPTRQRRWEMKVSFPDVIITSYSKLSGWADFLAPLVKSVTYDEVQELRQGDKTNKGMGAYTVSEATDYRLGLSATPIYNLGGEIYAVMQAIAPGMLGSKEEFNTEHCHEADSRGRRALKDPKAFGSYLRSSGLMLRRTRQEVKIETPKMTRIVHDVDMDDRVFKNIKNRAQKLASIIVEKHGVKGWDMMQASKELSHLMRHATGVGKAPYVAEFVRLLVENDQKVVLFGWHLDVYEIWKIALKDYNPAMYTGEQSPEQKQKEAKRFIEEDTKILIMSLRAGAGLDGLQGVCSTLVFGELDWSPAVHQQNEGRLDRPGQDDPVVAYYLVSDEGSDPTVMDTLGVKRAQGEGFRNPDQDIIEDLEVDGDRIKMLAQNYLDRLSSKKKTKNAKLHEDRI